MFFTDVVNSTSIPAMDAMLSFTQAQHKVLAENVANIDTPGYKVKHLDPRRFQRALATAMQRKEEENASELKLESTDQFERGRDGLMKFTPTLDPAENVLFHDQTNARIERQMALLAENAMMHQTVAELLNGRYQGLLKAIRGRMS